MGSHKKNSLPLISVIICTKIRANKIAGCIASLINNSFKDFELIVLDQSPDYKTKKLVKKFKNVSYFRINKRALSFARNFGIKKAKAEIVAFIDDDCLADRNWLKRIYYSFSNYPEVVGIYGKTIPYKSEQDKNLFYPRCFSLSKLKEVLISKPAKHWDSIGYGNNMAFRKEIFNILGYFKTWLGPGSIGLSAEDVEFALRALINQKKLLYQSKMLVLNKQCLRKKERKKAELTYLCGEVACYGYLSFKKNCPFARRVIRKNIYLTFFSEPNKILRAALNFDKDFFIRIHYWLLLLKAQARGFSVALIGFFIDLIGVLIKGKAKLLKFFQQSKSIIVYCSVVPHNSPPYSWYNAAQHLSQFKPVIFIDRLNPIGFSSRFSINKFANWFCFKFFKFKKFTVWNFDFFLSEYILYFYLSALKSIFNYKIILITNTSKTCTVYKFVPYSFLVFECTDKYYSKQFSKNRLNIKNFDLVLSNTKILTNEIKKINQKVYRISSGYSEDLSLSINLAAKKIPKIPKSIVFSGGISRRIDYKLLRKVIKKLPSYKFFFIGELYLDQYYQDGTQDGVYLKKWNTLLNLPNMYYLGSFSRKQSINLLSFFTCALIPYDCSNKMNYYSHPVKFYEYLFANLAIISTPIASILEYSDLEDVYIIQTVEEMVRAIKQICKKKGFENKKERQLKISKILHEQSTELKSQQILKYIATR